MRLTYRYQIQTATKRYQNVKSIQPVPNSSYAKDVPVLLYHGILKDRNDGFSIAAQKFEEQMINLKQNGYNTISMADYTKFINGQLQLPAKSILITFDDGRKDSFYRADPILKGLGFRAVMFAASGYSLVDGSNYYLDQSEILKMHRSGRWDIQAHADKAGTGQIIVDTFGQKGNFYGNYKYLPQLGRLENIEEYRQRVNLELSTVKQRFEKTIPGLNITSMSFPFGDFGQANPDKLLTQTLIDETDNFYQLAFIQFRKGWPYSSNYPKQNFLSRRLEINPNLSGQQLVALLQISHAKDLPFLAKFNSADGWVAETGEIAINDQNNLTLAAADQSFSALSYLDGSRHWQNYKITSLIENLAAHSTINILANFIDSQNYLACSINRSSISIISVNKGKQSIIKKININHENITSTIKINLSITNNQNLVCHYSNFEISSNIMSFDSGGVGLQVVNSTKGKARLKLSKFIVEPI